MQNKFRSYILTFVNFLIRKFKLKKEEIDEEFYPKRKELLIKTIYPKVREFISFAEFKIPQTHKMCDIYGVVELKKIRENVIREVGLNIIEELIKSNFITIYSEKIDSYEVGQLFRKEKIVMKILIVDNKEHNEEILNRRIERGDGIEVLSMVR